MMSVYTVVRALAHWRSRLSSVLSRLKLSKNINVARYEIKNESALQKFGPKDQIWQNSRCCSLIVKRMVSVKIAKDGVSNEPSSINLLLIVAWRKP